MFRISDLRQKDMVNMLDGKKLGPVRDIEIDLEQGKVMALILPGSPKGFSLFARQEDIILEWQRIHKIGVDVVLVELPHFSAPKHGSAGIGKKTNLQKKADEVDSPAQWLDN